MRPGLVLAAWLTLALIATAAPAAAPPDDDPVARAGLITEAKLLVLPSEHSPELLARLDDFRKLRDRVQQTLRQWAAAEESSATLRWITRTEIPRLEHERNEHQSLIHQLLRGRGVNARLKLNNIERAQLAQWEHTLDNDKAAINDLQLERQRLQDRLPRPPELKRLEESARGKWEDHLRRTTALRSLVDPVTLKYEALKRDPELNRALRLAPGRPRLGPSDRFLAISRELAEGEALVRYVVIAAERQGGLYRVEAQVNSQADADVVLDLALNLTRVPASLAGGLGLDDGSGGDDPAGSRKPRTGRAMLASVRLGALTLNNVACEVVAGDRAGDAIRLGQNALRSVQVRYDPESNQLLIVRAASPAGNRRR